MLLAGLATRSYVESKTLIFPRSRVEISNLAKGDSKTLCWKDYLCLVRVASALPRFDLA